VATSTVMAGGRPPTRTTYYVYIDDAIIKSIIMKMNKVQKIPSAWSLPICKNLA
jgi:hypothetical protein